MAVAKQLQEYLDQQDIDYDLVEHPRTECTSETAQAAHIPGTKVLKTVVIHREQGCVLAVVPSTHRIRLDALQDILGAPLGLASETEIAELFDDCELGAVPPVGAAYDLPVMLDQGLSELDDVYFEAGDHRTLVHVNGAEFKTLMHDARNDRFSSHI